MITLTGVILTTLTGVITGVMPLTGVTEATTAAIADLNPAAGPIADLGTRMTAAEAGPIPLAWKAGTSDVDRKMPKLISSTSNVTC